MRTNPGFRGMIDLARPSALTACAASNRRLKRSLARAPRRYIEISFLICSKRAFTAFPAA